MDGSFKDGNVFSSPPTPSDFASAGHSASRFASVSFTPKLSSVSKLNAGSNSSKKEYRDFISLIADDECDYAEKEDPDFLEAIEASLSESKKIITKETSEELVSKFREA